MKYLTLKNKILNDEYTEYVYKTFDIQNKEETVIKIPINFNECKTFDWNIGVIYGGSGTGKTSLLKQFGQMFKIQFDPQKPLISNFYWLEPKDATFLLSAMGLSSVPTWLRPFHLLSNGEQYRAELAYKVGIAKNNEVILIDEFTSVVDRDVAKAMSFALQKYIRKTNKKIILASCHFDIMEWLLPDWTYSPLKGRLEKAPCRRQNRPKIELQIFRCRYETWNLFKQHHYLSQNLNKAAKCFILTFNNKPVSFIAILPFPHGHLKNAFRISRIVVLPDYQGLGLGFKIIDYFGSLYAKNDSTLYIKTSNPALFSAMNKNQDKWLLCSEFNEKDLDSKKLIVMRKANNIGGFKNAITKSYKYIGSKSNDSTNIINFNSNAYKTISQNQISIF
jgi:ABC-type lipoprotein export system ATPase subunit/predicted acetyltransferase